MSDTPWTMHAGAVARELEVDPAQGLSTSQVGARRLQYGPNELRQKVSQRWWRVLVEQLRSFLVALLAVGAALSIALGEWLEGLAIVAVIVVNAAIGFVVQLRAVRSMEALRTLGSRRANVRREGGVVSIPAEDLVPGDVVVVAAGDVSNADLRILTSSLLQADESILTGESVPIDKNAAPVSDGAVLGDRTCMLFKGTHITRGSGDAIVVATGMATELGRISALVEGVDSADTPLEKRLDQLGRTLGLWSLGFVAVIASIGIASGRDLVLMIETAIALAVATVPEGLPIVATVALARGMWRMARHNALVNKPAVVEALGATSVILTDKTGTLTENRMRVARVEVPGASVRMDGPLDATDADRVRPILEVAALCTDSLANGAQAMGDPMERALIEAAGAVGMDLARSRQTHPEVEHVAFDATVRMMATFHDGPDGLMLAAKGAAEALIPQCTALPDCAMTPEAVARWLGLADSLGDDGLRVIAVATRAASDTCEPFQNLTLLGLVGLLDPPRASAAEAIGVFAAAGIRVVVVTGDHPSTAANIARRVGLAATPDRALRGVDLRAFLGSEEGRARVGNAVVIARTSPEEKLDLIAFYQASGHVTAMIGDGVNDAPALRKADVGVAMGLRGSQVAREAAAMVLLDDELGTVATAIRQGRVIFGNLRRFVVYLLSCNLSEILCVGVAAALDAPLPILPLQILFLNLVTDVFPALALGVGEGDEREMAAPPLRRSEPILGRSQWTTVVGWSAVMAACVLGAFAWATRGLGMDDEAAVTVSFSVLCLSQLLHVFNMTTPGARAWVNDVTRNPWVWAALVLCVGLLLAGLYLPVLSDVLKTGDPGAAGWAVILTMSGVPFVLGRGWSWLRSALSAG